LAIALFQPERDRPTIPDKQKAIAPHQNTSKSDRSSPIQSAIALHYSRQTKGDSASAYAFGTLRERRASLQ
jgi:hypothetical protein